MPTYAASAARRALQGDRRRACEACHGPAGDWMRARAAPGATHADNVAHGLFRSTSRGAGEALPVVPLRQRDVRHPSHHGRGPSAHALRAGHLLRHRARALRGRPDWKTRKGEWDGVRVWAVGQTLAAAELLDVLLIRAAATTGSSPSWSVRLPRVPSSDERACAGRRVPGVAPGRAAQRFDLLMVAAIARRGRSGSRQPNPPRGEAAAEQRVTVAGDGVDPRGQLRRRRAWTGSCGS